MINSRIFNSLLALGMVTVLFGCGGSSSSSDDDDSKDRIDASLQGNAAKGIVIRGKVTARELNRAGAPTRVVGKAVTGADGSYSFDLKKKYKGGPILIEVTNGPKTTMVCDAPAGCGTRTDGLTSADDPDNNDDGLIDFGEEYKPANLSMTALLADAEDGETIDMQLTPFTHMASQRALSGRSIDAAAINAANSKVSNLLGGLDILRTQPVDVTDPASIAGADALDIVYAALGAALVELANDDANGQPDLDQALADLAAEFAGGTFTAASLQDILDEAANTLGATGAVDTSGMLNAIQARVEDAIANNGGVIDPDTTPNPDATDVALAKYFISDLRTWSTVISDELDAPSEAFQDQIDLTQDVADLLDDAAADAFRAGIDAVMDLFDGVLVGTDLTGYVSESGSFTAGTITQAAVTDAIAYTISNASVDTDQGTATLDMVLVAPGDDTQVSRIVWGIESAVVEGDNARWVLNGGTVIADLETPYDVDYDLPDLPTPFIDVLMLDLDLTRTQKTELDYSTWPPQVVPAVDPVTFGGGVQFTIHTILDSNGEEVALVPGSLVLDGEASNTSGDSVDFDFALSVPNAASIMPLGPIYDLHSTYADNNGGDHLISWQYGVNTFTYDAIHLTWTFTFNPGDGSVDVVITSDSGFFREFTDRGGPYASINAFTATISGLGTPYIEFIDDFTSSVSIDGQGTYERAWDFNADYTTDGFEEFILEEVDLELFDETQPAIGNVGLQFAVQLDGLPEATISVTANVTGFEEGNANVTISYAPRQLVFEASNETGSEVGTFEITNQDGVKLLVDFDNLEDDNSINDITINNKVIGTLEELDSGAIKISYIDGTFEIF